MNQRRPSRRVWPRRPGWIYAVVLRHPDTGRPVRFGYIGKTTRLDLRMAQHEAGARWRHLIISWDVLWYSPDVSRFGLWWREIWYIMTRFPLMNYQWNRHNPRRIPIYQQRSS